MARKKKAVARRRGPMRNGAGRERAAGRRIALVLGSAFFALAAVVYATPHLLIPFDAAIRDAFAPLQTYAWSQAFLVVTALGGGVGIIAIAIAFGALARLAPAAVLRLAAVLTAVAVACRIVKVVTERARPEAVVWLEQLSAYSFPSAHAASAGALYGAISLWVYRRTRSVLLAAVPLVAAGLVGVSRIALGAHHASDVVGGFLLAGTALAAAAAFPFERLVKKYG